MPPVDLHSAAAQHPSVDNEKIINEVMGGSLRVLNRIADSPLVERLGLEERAQQLVYEGAKRAAETAAKTAQRLSSKRASDGPRESRKFDLSLSEEQQLMRDTLRRLADELMQPAAREADDRLAPPDDFLEAFSELGAIAMSVPGGDGRGGRARCRRCLRCSSSKIWHEATWAWRTRRSRRLSFVNALVHWGDASSASLASFVPWRETMARVSRSWSLIRFSIRAPANDGQETRLATTCSVARSRWWRWRIARSGSWSQRRSQGGPRFFLVDGTRPASK